MFEVVADGPQVVIIYAIDDVDKGWPLFMYDSCC
jgi:hypothetical protein